MGESISLPAGEAFSDAFHVFSVVWQADQITWLMDDAPFFFILNVAVGGNWPGYPDATTSFPQSMVVDCVRVFQAN